jgi:hypothetical protein
MYVKRNDEGQITLVSVMPCECARCTEYLDSSSPEISSFIENEITKAGWPNDYLSKRKTVNPKLDDVLEAIVSVLSTLKDGGIDIGESGDLLVASYEEAHTMYPKPSEED